MPATLLDKPELPASLDFVWDAFWRLHTDRPQGPVGLGHVPHRSALAETERLGMDRDEADWFLGLVAAMDRTFLKWQDAQRPKRDAQRD